MAKDRGTGQLARARIVRAALPLLLIALAGCRPGYVLRVGWEHLRYLNRARPIAEEIETSTDPERRHRLELVLAARDYASAAGLDPGGSYLEISDTTGLATAYVVTAAYADRLEAYEWSYPVVGRIPYRGYFERERADEFAAELDARGLDTHVVEASGYSTLGWFDDPLPSGVLDLDDIELVTLILHEILHQTLYVAGHIDFNETLASAVAGRLAISFFEERGESERSAEARERHARWLAQGRLLDALAARLREHFEASQSSDRAEMLAGRAAIYREAWPEMVELGLATAESDPATVVNNAVFLAVYRYKRRADLIDGYIGSHGSVADAVDALRTATDDVEDPYQALALERG